MDISYSDYIISKFSNVLDPFSLTEINTERLCYPVNYASEDIIKGWQGINKGKDVEDDLLIQQSLLKDFPDFEKSFIVQTYIADGAAHILRNRNRENLVQLLGMPMIGKSSLLKKIALLAAQEMKKDINFPVPLLINLEITMKNDISSKMELIEACFAQYEEFEAYLREKFFQGKIILLLDEFDKVCDMNKKLIEWIKALKTFVKLPLCVIASRYSGYFEIDNIPVLYVDIYPMKLQISMAQSMLSELQFDRFVEIITGNCGFYSELASTPYLFSLLLEMFRWGIIGTEEPISRGKLYWLTVTYLLGVYNTPQIRQAFEMIAVDLLLRDAKYFMYFDVKNLGIEHLWTDLKASQILLIQNNYKEDSSSGSEGDLLKENTEGEIESGEVKESGILLNYKELSRRDTTPHWVSNSKESLVNYQIARKCIVKNTFEEVSSETYRFLHLRLLEVIAAQSYLNQIEDSLLHSSGGFLMESFAFQRSFSTCFPANFLFSRRFREVLLLISSLCSENIFENLIKYLLNKERIEYCYIAERLLKERGVTLSHRPLLNKLKQDKLEFSKRSFAKSFYHPSDAVQKLCRNDALESGLTEYDIEKIINKNIDFVLKNTHWLYLKQLNRLGKDLNIKVIKAIYNKLLEVSFDILSCIARSGSYKTIIHKVILSMFLNAFDQPEISPQNYSHFTPSVSYCMSPNKLDNEKFTEESTIRISFDKIKIPKNEAAIIEKIGSTSRLISVLIDLLQICPAIDLALCIKTLLTIGCSISQIHISLASRFSCLEDLQERKEILKIIKNLGFVTQYTIDIPLICLQYDKDLQNLAKDIIKLLNTDKLKKHALSILITDDSPQLKILLALRALRFTGKGQLDQEILYLLVQFIDHYSLELRLEAIKSLYKIIKTEKSLDNNEIRKTLAVVPHVLKDRIKLLRYDSNLRIHSLKCLIALWIGLDKGKEESNTTEMFHILVKEQIGSSYLVGNFPTMIWIVKEFIQKTQEERETAWICLKNMSPILDILDTEERFFLINELKNGLFREYYNETKAILKFLIINPVTEEEKSALLSIILSSSFETRPKLIRYIAILLINWHEIISVKILIQVNHHITPELSRIFSKLKLLIENFYNCINDNSSILISEIKNLHNMYKSLINQVAENMQWPSKVFPHRNHLLDISADPSFFKEESAPEFSCSYPDLDSSFPKNSMDSANTDLEEQPPPIEICHHLISAGIRSKGLKHWILWYLKRSESLHTLSLASESWNFLSHNKDYYNPHTEDLLLKFLPNDPEEIAKIVINIRFKSDTFCIKLIDNMIKGHLYTDTLYKAIIISMELNTPIVLEEVYKIFNITQPNPIRMFFLQNCAAKILETLNISNEGQMHSVLKALVSTGCSLFVQHIWNYWMKATSQKPSYVISIHALNILENCDSWDCKFLLSRAKILGLIPVYQYHKETGSSMSTKRL